MSNPKWEEIIVVAPREKVFGPNDKLASQGIILEKNAMDILANLSSSVFLARRGHVNDPTPKENNAEINTDLKQPIPYGVIISDNEEGKMKVFGYQRLEGGGEARLHGKISIGVGGHMNELFTPETLVGVVLEEAHRELVEELTFGSAEGTPDVTRYPVSIVGVINDEEDEVGKVHLGLLYTLDVNPAHTVEVREKDQLDGRWYTLDELESLRGQLEGWSGIALDALKKIYA